MTTCSETTPNSTEPTPNRRARRHPEDVVVQRYMSPQECAVYAGCSVDHVRDLITRGHLAAFRLGNGRGRIRVRVEDLEACFRPVRAGVLA